MWRTSSYTREGNCVQIAELGVQVISIQDSKHPDGPRLALDRTELVKLVGRIKAGALDL